MIGSENEYIIITDYSVYDEILKNVKASNNKYNANFFINNSLLAVDCCAIGKPN